MMIRTAPPEPGAAPLRVTLFVTCLVETLRPSVALAARRLLEEAGCVAVLAEGAPCCGQPAYNAGERALARAVAAKALAALEKAEHIVVPSGSCAAMIIRHWPALFADDPTLKAKAEAVASRTHELTEFLHDVLGAAPAGQEFARKATYHDSCSGLRELGIKAQPRALLAPISGLTLSEMADPESCCGFGGMFCVKHPEISAAIAARKLDQAKATGADLLLGGDLGCLYALAGAASRQGERLEIRHIAEVLADIDDELPAMNAQGAKS